MKSRQCSSIVWEAGWNPAIRYQNHFVSPYLGKMLGYTAGSGYQSRLWLQLLLKKIVSSEGNFSRVLETGEDAMAQVAM